MFSVQQLQHRYSDKVILNIEHLEAKQGELVLLKGTSGSGKTTFLHILAMLLSPTQGKVSIAGKEVSKLNGAEADLFRGQNIGVIFQQTHLVKTLSVADNMLLAQYMAGKKQDRKACQAMLERLNVGYTAKQYPSQLSRGEAQRVVIGRALLNRPSVVLADEPTASLDQSNAQTVGELLTAEARQQNATLLVVTHDSRIEPLFQKVWQLHHTTIV